MAIKPADFGYNLESEFVASLLGELSEIDVWWQCLKP